RQAILGVATTELTPGFEFAEKLYSSEDKGIRSSPRSIAMVVDID
ncbi:1490_t:CDS:2, partial [Racocetra fulgida]